jgi:hypothetical protein
MEIAEGGHPHVLANWFPLALKAPTSDWLLRLPQGSVRSWAHLCEQFLNAFQGGYTCLGTLNDLLVLSQHPKEMLRSIMQCFWQLAHGVLNTSNGKIIVAFIARVCDNGYREELGIRKPSTVSELYALVDECAQEEEGWLAPEHAAQTANGPVPTDKKKETRKRASKHILVAEPGPPPTTDKKIKPDAPVVPAAAPTQGAWCPIHETNSHDLKTCRTVYGLAETRKKRLAERGTADNADNCYSCGQPGHLRDCPGRFPRGGGASSRGGGHVGARGGHGGGRGNPPREPDRHPTGATGEVGVAKEYH